MIDSSTTPEQLAFKLGTNLKKLNYIAYVKDMPSQYGSFEISKKSGGLRVIRAPKKGLKYLQKRLKNILDNLYKPHSAASAFISGRGIVYNAEKHVKKAAVFNIDLEGFYDQIHFGRIMGLLMSKPYSLQKKTAQIIANICCVDKVLPQGAPTSPVISNMICRRLDRELSKLSKDNQAQYSRYADDMTFSFRTLKENSIVSGTKEVTQPSDELLEIIQSNGFDINSKKTRYQTYDQRQTVTGLKVNTKVNIDRRYIRTTRAMIYALSKGEIKINESYQKEQKDQKSGSLLMMVAGRLNFISMVKGIESTVYQGLSSKFNSLDYDFKVNTTPRLDKKSRQNLPFFKPENKARLEDCVWVITFFDVEGIGEEEEYIQGSAFMFEKQRIITAAHVFEKAGYPEYCFIHRIGDKSKKYKAKLLRENKVSDIAELCFLEKPEEGLNFLKRSRNKHVNSGYEVAVVGFPEYHDSQLSVSIKVAKVTFPFVKSTFNLLAIDVDIHSGNSGGPVVDGYLNVVGIAVMGMTAGEGGIEGTNAFVSIEHIDKFE